MMRFSTLLIAGGAAALLTPAPASAQFVRPLPPLPGLPSLPIGPSLPGLSGLGTPRMLPSLPGLPARSLPSLPGLPTPPTLPSLGGTPSVSPYYYTPRYAYTSGIQVGGISYRQTYVGINPPVTIYPLSPRYSAYGQTGSYLTGSPSTRADPFVAAQRNLANAQRQAGNAGAKAEIVGQGNFEKGVAPAPQGAGPMPQAMPAAPEPPDRAAILSGDALNALLKDVAAAEAKGAKGPSGYVPPLLFEDVRFAHTPAGDLLNLARRAGSLDFPGAFDDPALAPLRGDLEKNFAAAAVAVQAGRAPEAEKVTRLEATVQKAQDAAGPVVKNLPFEDAFAVRQFLNELSGAVKAMKTGAAAGLIDPKWSAEGLTVADLTRHMARHKVQFGPAPQGGGEAYETMYRNLASYLSVLNQPKK